MAAVFGYQLSSITPYLQTIESLQSSFQRIAEIGYQCVHLQGVPADTADDAIVDALQSSGLTCIATQEDYPLGFGAEPDRAIQRAVACGAKYLTCALIPKEVDSPSKLDKFAEVLSGIAEKVRDAGLTFAFHPISPDYREMDGQMVFERLMNNLPDHTQLTFCVAAAHSAGVNPDIIFDRYAGRMDLVHFKDFGTQPNGSQHMMPLGQGDHDWGPILQKCNAASVKYIFAEQEKWLKDPFECARESWDYLQTIR